MSKVQLEVKNSHLLASAKLLWVVAHAEEADALVADASCAVAVLSMDDGEDISDEWTPGKGVGDWGPLDNTLKDVPVHVTLPWWHGKDNKGQAFRNKLKSRIDRTGAKVTIHKMKQPDSMVAQLAKQGSVKAVLESWKQSTGPSLIGAIRVDSADRIRVLNQTIAQSIAKNDARQSMFLSGVLLVQVFEGKIFPMDSVPKFQGWCSQNGVDFYTETEDGDDVYIDFQLAPADVGSVIVSNPAIWKGGMLRLKSVSTLPFVRQDGTYIQEPGYDKQLQVFNVDQRVGEFAKHVPDEPTKADAVASAKWLMDEIFVDFPFVTAADWANTLGLMVMALTRHVHERPSPLFGITAPDAGTGKDLLAEACSLILQGQLPSLQVLPPKEDDQRKKITGLLKDDPNPVAVWGNMPTGSRVSSPVLCALHTTPQWTDRVLGSSSSITLENDRVWIATGNNMGPGEDMVRRWVSIRLDAGMPHPEQRTGFKHKDLKAWVLEHRDEAVAHLMTMVQAWIAAERPRPIEDTPVMGDYQPIVNVVGGVLNYADVFGFLMNSKDVQGKAEVGSEEEVAEEFLHWMWGSLPLVGCETKGFTTKQIRECISLYDGYMSTASMSEVPMPPTVAAALSNGTTATSVAINHWLSKMEGRGFGPEKFRLAIIPDTKIDRGQAWRLTAELKADHMPHPLVARELMKRANRVAV